MSKQTFTGFCQQSNGKGTVWIGSFESTRELAIETARGLCAEVWGYDRDAIHVLGIAEGDVNILHWEDICDAG